MTTMPNLLRTLAIAAFAATLSACSSTPVALPKPTLQDMLSQANQAVATGQKEKAVTLWQQTATAYPADKTPWVNIAQTRYESGQYGEAIVSAQEILVRDPSNTLANSIIATSGLRLSTRALGDLSRQNNLTGNVKTESQELAKLLRESLGENTLFAVSTQKSAPPEVEKKYVQKKKIKVSSDTDSKADPFSALK
ncbi:MAG: hypothetical protein V4631_22700 [Pseudomonadota bacterium]